MISKLSLNVKITKKRITSAYSLLSKKQKVFTYIILISLSFLLAGIWYLQNDASTQKTSNKTNATGSTIGVDLDDEVFEGLEAKTDGECSGIFQVNIPDVKDDDIELCTVGPESTKDLEESGQGSIFGDNPIITDEETDSEITEQKESSFKDFRFFEKASAADDFAAPTDLSVPCYGDGQSGPRVQAIYMTTEDRSDRYDLVKPYIASWAGYVDAKINESAQKTEGEAHVKWVTDAECQLDVKKVVVPAGEQLNFTNTIYFARQDGHRSADRKYLIWVDANILCGVANTYRDERADPYLNYNSAGGAMYARVDNMCWGRAQSAELHELLHMLGAVQLGAPNSTGFGHCTDDYDIMCYNDGGKQVRTVCRDQQSETLADCNDDDYFSASPEAGSYLDTSWNVYNSRYLFSKQIEDQEPPSLPNNLQGSWDGEKVVLNWDPSTDNSDGEILYKVYRSDSINRPYWQNTGETSDTTFNDQNVELGKGYLYRVVAIDLSGNVADPGGYGIIVSIPDDGEPDPPKEPVTPMGKITNLYASNVTTNSFDLSWQLPTDSPPVTNIRLYINDLNQADLSSSTTTYSVCCSLTSSTKHKVYIIAYGENGQFSQSDLLYVTTNLSTPDPSPDPDPEPEPDPTTGPPPAVSNLQVKSISDSSFSVQWDYLGTHPDVTDIDVFIDGAPTWSIVNKYSVSASSSPGLEGGIYNVVVRTIDGDGNTTDASIDVTTSNYYDPSDISNLKPYNLRYAGADASYCYITATINSTGGAAYRHEFAAFGNSFGAQWYLTNRNYTHDVTFRASPTCIADGASYYVIVKDIDGNTLTSSDPLNL